MSTVTEIFDTMEYGPAPESSNEARAWIESRGGEFGVYIGGAWRTVESHFDTHFPGDGSKIARIAQCGKGEIDAAVEAARQALPVWQGLSGAERAKYLYALARQIQKHSRLFATVESLDNGKPIRETRDIDIPLVARHFYHHAGWAQLRDSELAGYEPVGVCAQIIPWNFPLLMLAWKIAPALAMGNTVVLKPAEFTSLTALLFAEICDAIGLPAGVVNIVTGDGEAGKLMVEHPGVDKVAFTGSTEVGRILRVATAGTGKKLSLELGGKSAFVVFEDADLDAAIEGLVDAIWFNQGQVCCAGSRLLVQENIAELAIAKTKERMARLRVGDPLDKAIDIGAIVAPVQVERIRKLVEAGVQDGASLYQPPGSCPKDGWFYPPTLLTNCSPASDLAQVEIFGPVLVAMTFKTYAEAIEIANNTAYGLAASVWTENLNLAFDVASALKAGTVWVNCTNQFDAASGFGGYRESGFGREGGKEGLYEYLKPKGLFGDAQSASTAPEPPTAGLASGLDRTHKLYIGGQQVRPDGGYSMSIQWGGTVHEVAKGNRKDIRNAVEAAEKARASWEKTTAHGRAQILYYLAENLGAERRFLEPVLPGDAASEIEASIERIMHYAAWADKYDGATHSVPMRGFAYTRNEPIGVAAVLAPDEMPLLSFLSVTLPLWVMGNPVVAVPSERFPLPACELIRVLETSDVPAGTLNIVTGEHRELAKTLAEHDGIQVMWQFGDAELGAEIERASAANLKQTWVSHGHDVDWRSVPSSEFLRRATQVKNVWVPTGA